MSRMDQSMAPLRHGLVFPLQYIGMASYNRHSMRTDLDLPLHRLPRTPVLLLGGVNLVRTLGLAGIPAIVASPDPQEPAFSSRYCVGRCLLPPLDHEGAVDALVRIGDRLAVTYGRRIPLMYGSDESLELLYRHRERLQRYFLFLLNDPEVAEGLLEKDRFQELGESRGLPVAKTLAWDGDHGSSLAAFPGPVVVKPRSKVDWHASAMRERLFEGESKARIFADGQEAAAHPAVALFREQLAFQEYIPGDDGALWSFHGLADENGVVLASFVGRKLRTFPPDTGESAFIELDQDEELRALGTEVAARLPLKGVFKMDFKRDPRNARWYLFEINARFTLWHYLGAANGVNLMAATYDFLLEGSRPELPSQYRRDYRWLSFALDRRAFGALRARGEIGWAEWLASLATLRNVYSMFSWSDPGPWLRFWSNRLGRRWLRGSDVLFALVRQWRSTAS